MVALLDISPIVGSTIGGVIVLLVVTVVAALFGGAVLEIIGALIAIPVTAAARVLLMETLFPGSTAPETPRAQRVLCARWFPDIERRC